ncbi:hypothetical protein [Myxosarcina sp. GI1]|uniref:type II toxin-antitoxin system MazE family antitoxin n=1 Tax=Myxosarcina sp. GI1 TaxID=1541065 RepID=UPI0005656CE8|nr:hypothetical protein [Myxosarcina sp. GI1]
MSNISISVDDENLSYLNSQVSNRSKYINDLIAKDRATKFEEKMREGYLAQKNNSQMKEEDRLWEITLGDGIEDD